MTDAEFLERSDFLLARTPRSMPDDFAPALADKVRDDGAKLLAWRHPSDPRLNLGFARVDDPAFDARCVVALKESIWSILEQERLAEAFPETCGVEFEAFKATLAA